MRARILPDVALLPKALVLVALACCSSAAPCGPRGATPRSRVDMICRLRDFVFSRTVTTSGTTEAFLYKEHGYDFRKLEDILQYNSQAAHAVAGTAVRFDLEDTPLESSFWWAIRTTQGATAFVQGLARVLGPEMRARSRVHVRSFGGVLDKALAQRDLLQVDHLLLAAEAQGLEATDRVLASQLDKVISAALKATLLDASEYESLVAALPQTLPADFTSQQNYSLAENYLPMRVISADTSWAEISGGGTPFRHYTTYGGRSFVKVYVRAPQRSREEMIALWKRLFTQYGDKLHISSVKEDVPPGMETLLVRTFGVFQRGGAFRDSYWPEEVTLRVFKYGRAQIDTATSDFRGTMFFKYTLSRAALLEKPASLGLRRTLDDDRQFFGFLGDVPDRQHAYTDTVTTLRSNCIACHSELYYGLPTIFSFERNPENTAVLPMPEELQTVARQLGAAQQGVLGKLEPEQVPY